MSQNIKPLIISRTLPFLGGREVMVDKLINFFDQKNGVVLLSPDIYPNKKIPRYSTKEDFKVILKWVEKQKVTVINCHTFYLSDLVIYLSKELKIPLVFTLHGVFIDYYGKKYGSLLKNIYKNSDVIVTVSDNYRIELGKYIGDSKKIITIKNGIDLKQIDNFDKTKDYYRKSIKISKDKCVIVIPARLTYIKGLNYLIRAINKVKDKNLLFVLCSPKGRKKQEELLYKNKLLNMLTKKELVKFKYLNNLELFNYYAAADAVLLPSLIEGISISILEAMAFSLLVVATNVGGNSEIITDGENGYLIKSKNVNAILEGVEKIRSFENNKIKVNAKKTVKKYFSVDRMFDEYYKIFKKIKYEDK